MAELVPTFSVASILDIGGRNYQVGNQVFMTRILMAFHYFCHRKDHLEGCLNVRLTCHCCAAIPRGPCLSPITPQLPHPFLIAFPSVFLANVSARSKIVYFLFLVDFKDSISFSLSSPCGLPHLSSQHKPSHHTVQIVFQRPPQNV